MHEREQENGTFNPLSVHPLPVAEGPLDQVLAESANDL